MTLCPFEFQITRLMLMCVVQALMVSRILWAELLFELFTQLVFRHPLGLHFHLHTLAAFDLNRHFADERVLVETCATFFLAARLSFSNFENTQDMEVLNLRVPVKAARRKELHQTGSGCTTFFPLLVNLPRYEERP